MVDDNTNGGAPQEQGETLSLADTVNAVLTRCDQSQLLAVMVSAAQLFARQSEAYAELFETDEPNLGTVFDGTVTIEKGVDTSGSLQVRCVKPSE